MVVDGNDWVKFETAESFQPGVSSSTKKARDRYSHRPKTRDGSRRRASDSPSTASWMEKPIPVDSSWLPIAPPQNRDPPEERDDGDALRTQPVRPPKGSRHRASSTGSSDIAQSHTSPPSRKHEKSSSHGEFAGPLPSRGRSRSKTREAPIADPAPLTRGRSSSHTRGREETPRSSSKTRLSSKTRVASPSPTRNARSASMTRGASPAPRNRTRSSSQTRLKSPLPSGSGRRAPSPSPRNRNRSSSKTRQSRSRSLSRPRSVAGPSPRHLPRQNSSSSVGGGVPPRHSHSPFSDISVSSERRASKGGILERFFGDQVTEEAKQGHKRRANSAASVGSLVEQQPDSIHPRVLLSATVYKNAATNLWIATINTNQKGVATNPKTASKYLKAFSFASEKEAREAAIANAPPKMMPFDESPNCFVCKGKFAVFRRACHCRNCGACVCSGCTTALSCKMLPETYNLKNESTLKVCKSCNYLTDCFRKALLKGDFAEALGLYATGNINLRCPLPPSPGAKKFEIMYPIHCAVQGGSLDLVCWLMDEHFCPITSVQKTSNGKGRKPRKLNGGTPILTSKGRSVLNLAMHGLKVDIVRYLVVDKGLSVYEVKDLKTSLRALEAVLLAFPAKRSCAPIANGEIAIPRWDQDNFSDDVSYVCSSLGEDQSTLGPVSGEFQVSFNEPNRDGAVDMCIICYDNPIDCVITPCGHQICCLECSSNLKICPVCNVDCAFIRIFKP